MGITRASNPTPHHFKSFGDTFQWISGTRASFNNDHSISSELINFWPVDPMKCSSRIWNTILKEVKTNHVQLFMKTPRLAGSCLLQTAGALFAGRPPPAVHYDQHNHLDTSSASCTHKEIHVGVRGEKTKHEMYLTGRFQSWSVSWKSKKIMPNKAHQHLSKIETE